MNLIWNLLSFPIGYLSKVVQSDLDVPEYIYFELF